MLKQSFTFKVAVYLSLLSIILLLTLYVFTKKWFNDESFFFSKLKKEQIVTNHESNNEKGDYHTSHANQNQNTQSAINSLQPGDCERYKSWVEKIGTVHSSVVNLKALFGDNVAEEKKLEGTICRLCANLTGRSVNNTQQARSDIQEKINKEGYEDTFKGSDGPSGSVSIFSRHSEILIFEDSFEPKGGWDSAWVENRKKDCDLPIGGCFSDTEKITTLCVGIGTSIKP